MPNQSMNLMTHAGGPNVWDRQVQQNSRRTSLRVIGLLMIASGACLVAQTYQAGLFCAMQGRIRPFLKGRKRDNVDKASHDSFPASDPPSWTPAVSKTAGAEDRL